MEYSQQFRNKFHPDHLADLAKSGLTEQTITVLGIHSGRPQDIASLVGWDPKEVESFLVFPYPGMERFCRVKVFPPIRDKDDHTIRYLQRRGSGCHLYITPSAQAILNDPRQQLSITEGEKKAATLHQAGIAAAGLGGVWNWLERGEPLHDLDAIAWAGRDVEIPFDSNIWHRPDLLKAAYALGRELEDRAASVRVVQIPPVNGADAGADDFLIAHGLEAYRALPRRPLSGKAFTKLKPWHKDWLAKRPAPPLSPEALAQHLTPKPRLRFAQDLYEGHLFYGIGSGEQAYVLTSQREALPVARVQARAGIRPPKEAETHFSADGIKRFLEGAIEETAPLVRELTAYIARYMVFADSHTATVVALWTLGTYLYQLLARYPYLLVTSPAKRCGKTRLLELVAAVGFRCRGLTTSPTEAAIFRGAELHGGVEVMDEVEPLMSGRGDRERACQSVLNAGFQRGATVPRVQNLPDGTHDFEEFHVYRPRVLGGVGAFAETLEDRGILITLERKSPTQATARLVWRRLEAEAGPLRDRCAIWALTHADELAARLEALQTVDDLASLDDRARSLWEPLWLIADQAQREGSPEVRQTLLAAVAQAASERQAAEQDAALTGFLEALLEICEGPECVLRSKALLDELQTRLGEEAPRTAKGLATRLKRLRITRAKKNVDGKDCRAVILKRDHLEALLEQYAPAAEEKAHAPQGSV